MWLYKMYRTPYFIAPLYIGEQEFDIYNWINGMLDEKYLIYDKRSLDYEPFENEKYEILLNNSKGAILKRK